MLSTKQLMRQKWPPSSRCLKSRDREDTEQTKNWDHCCEDVQVPLRAPSHRRSGSDVNGMLTYWDLWLLAQICKDNGSKPHSEDQLKLRYLPEVNISLKTTGVNVKEF